MLSSSLQNFLSTLQASFYAFNFPVFKTLFDFGFRMNELYTLHLSEIDSNNIVHCITSKNNPYRPISLRSFQPIVQESILSNKNLFCHYKEDHYFKTFNYLYQYKNVRIGYHPKSVHLFRHNVAKQIYSSTQNVRDVMNFLGVVKEDTAFSYIFSLIISGR